MQLRLKSYVIAAWIASCACAFGGLAGGDDPAHPLLDRLYRKINDKDGNNAAELNSKIVLNRKCETKDLNEGASSLPETAKTASQCSGQFEKTSADHRQFSGNIQIDHENDRVLGVDQSTKTQVQGRLEAKRTRAGETDITGFSFEGRGSSSEGRSMDAGLDIGKQKTLDGGKTVEVGGGLKAREVGKDGQLVPKVDGNAQAKIREVKIGSSKVEASVGVQLQNLTPAAKDKGPAIGANANVGAEFKLAEADRVCNKIRQTATGQLDPVEITGSATDPSKKGSAMMDFKLICHFGKIKEFMIGPSNTAKFDANSNTVTQITLGGGAKATFQNNSFTEMNVTRDQDTVRETWKDNVNVKVGHEKAFSGSSRKVSSVKVTGGATYSKESNGGSGAANSYNGANYGGEVMVGVTW